MRFFLTLSFIFLTALIITSSYFIKSNFFIFTHSNWIKINNFEILDYKVYCSSSPWRRGMDRSARGNVKIRYNYKNNIYEFKKNDFLVLYRLNFFENCNELKNRNISLFKEINKNNEFSVFISPKTKEAKVLILKKNLSFRNSWMINFILEIQLIIIVIIGLTIYLSLSSKRKP